MARLVAVAEAVELQGGQAFAPLVEHVEVPEDLDPRQHHVVPVGDQLLPLVPIGCGGGGGDEAEVASLVVAANVKQVVAVIDAVLLILDPGGDQAQLAPGAARGQVADLAGGLALRRDEQELVAAGAGDPEVEPLVGLLVDEVVLLRVGPQAVPPQPVGPLGLGLLGDVEQGAPVVRPLHRRDPGPPVGQHLAAADVLDEEGVDPKPGGIEGVGQLAPVEGDLGGADAHELLGPADLVGIEQHLLGRAVSAPLAGPQGVLLALLGARVVEVPAVTNRDREVRLLDAGEHLGVKRVLQGEGGAHDRLGVGVLGPQVVKHLRGVLAAEPGVVVDPAVAVEQLLLWLAPGGGGSGNGSPGLGGRGGDAGAGAARAHQRGEGQRERPDRLDTPATREKTLRGHGPDATRTPAGSQAAPAGPDDRIARARSRAGRGRIDVAGVCASRGP